MKNFKWPLLQQFNGLVQVILIKAFTIRLRSASVSFRSEGSMLIIWLDHYMSVWLLSFITKWGYRGGLIKNNICFALRIALWNITIVLMFRIQAMIYVPFMSIVMIIYLWLPLRSSFKFLNPTFYEKLGKILKFLV